MKLFNWIKDLFQEDSKYSIEDLTHQQFDKTKFKARIAVVDDEEISHVKRLRNEGYNISDLNDIDVIDEFIRKKYHVVVLDIQGIGRSIAGSEEGWGILRYLKAECPHVIVIMFTGADWSVTKYKPLVDLADDFIGKDLEYLDFKSKLDSAIKKAFSPKFQFNITKHQIQAEISEDVLRKIETTLFKYGGNKSKALKEVRKISGEVNVLSSVDSYLSVMSSLKELIIE